MPEVSKHTAMTTRFVSTRRSRPRLTAASRDTISAVVKGSFVVAVKSETNVM